MHNDPARTLNPIPSFGREGRCVERRPMEMDDTKMHSLDHFSVVEKKTYWRVYEAELSRNPIVMYGV